MYTTRTTVSCLMCEHWWIIWSCRRAGTGVGGWGEKWKGSSSSGSRRLRRSCSRRSSGSSAGCRSCGSEKEARSKVLVKTSSGKRQDKVRKRGGTRWSFREKTNTWVNIILKDALGKMGGGGAKGKLELWPNSCRPNECSAQGPFKLTTGLFVLCSPEHWFGIWCNIAIRVLHTYSGIVRS